MNRLRFLFPVLLLASASAHAQSASDFRLPPAPTPTTNPDVQGPVDPDAPVPVRPRVIPTATPTPRPTPTATARPTPTPVPTATTRPAPQPTPRASATPQPRPTSSVPTTSPVPTDAPAGSPLAPSSPLPQPTETAPPASAPFNPGTVGPVTEPVSQDEPTNWLLWVGLIAALAALLAGFLWWKRRADASAPPPQIEAFVAEGMLDRTAEARIEFAVERMSRSMRTAMLTYRLTIANRSDVAVRDIVIESDLVGARNSLPLTQQLATEATELAGREDVGRIGPHQSRHITGQLNLSLGEVEPIMRGEIAFFVPLARFRIAGSNLPASHHTFVVGQKAEGGGDKLQPLVLMAPPGGLDRIGSRAVS